MSSACSQQVSDNVRQKQGRKTCSFMTSHLREELPDSKRLLIVHVLLTFLPKYGHLARYLRLVLFTVAAFIKVCDFVIKHRAFLVVYSA